MLNYLLTIQRKSINAWQSSSQWFTNAFFFDWYEDNSFFRRKMFVFFTILETTKGDLAVSAKSPCLSLNYDFKPMY
mgnify:CR=1 FL=1